MVERCTLLHEGTSTFYNSYRNWDIVNCTAYIRGCKYLYQESIHWKM